MRSLAFFLACLNVAIAVFAFLQNSLWVIVPVLCAIFLFKEAFTKESA